MSKILNKIGKKKRNVGKKNRWKKGSPSNNGTMDDDSNTGNDGNTGNNGIVILVMIIMLVIIVRWVRC